MGEPSFAAALKQRLAGRTPTDQKYLLVGLLNEHLGQGSQAVLVGGSLVELYTLGAVTSVDVDLVADWEAVAAILQAAGFEQPQPGLWRHADWDVLVNIVGPDLGPGETESTVTFEDLEIPVVTPEDCLVDRLCAAKFWASTTDREQSIILARALADDLDIGHLRHRAEAEGVGDLLEEVLDIVRP